MNIAAISAHLINKYASIAQAATALGLTAERLEHLINQPGTALESQEETVIALEMGISIDEVRAAMATHTETPPSLTEGAAPHQDPTPPTQTPETKESPMPKPRKSAATTKPKGKPGRPTGSKNKPKSPTAPKAAKVGRKSRQEATSFAEARAALATLQKALTQTVDPLAEAVTKATAAKRKIIKTILGI